MKRKNAMHSSLRFLLRSFFVLCFILACGAGTFAQDSSAQVQPSDGVLDRFGESLHSEQDESATAGDGQEADNATGHFSSKALSTYNDFTMRHNARPFSWQYYSGIAIFIIVVCIVLMGLFLSYRQFRLQEWKAMHPDKTITATKEEGAADFTTTTFEVSKEGIKINSAVIGLIILTISLVFFFLYLKYVYPIEGASGMSGK